MVKRSRAHASLASDNLGEGPKKARPATTAAATGRWAGLVDEPPQPRPRLVPRPPRDIAPVAVAPLRVVPVAASKPQLAPVDGAPLFRSLSIAPSTLKAIVEDMGYQSLTPVQAATLPVCLRGGDVLAKAKTGTGKTLAFLVPTIERLLKSERTSKTAIRALVLSPTRELASQTAAESVSLTAHSPGLRTAIVVGGNNAGGDRQRLAGQIDILIATPGRLKDHLQNMDGFASRLRDVQVLILDEGDQLLAAGFRPDIERILSYCGTAVRQTLCFSATLPVELNAVLKVALKPGHALVDCVGADAPDTHASVEQTFAFIPMAAQLGALAAAIEAEQRADPLAKIIVFFATARQTQFAAEALNALGLPSLEIHSRKSQSKRDAAAAAFRAAPASLMCSSDVSARGVDYPDVTLVIQVGAPSSREQYIHRLGRTGRAGKAGRGVLLLDPAEAFFIRLTSGLPIVQTTPAEVCRGPALDERRIAAAVDAVPRETKEQAYQAWLGYYNGVAGKMKWSKEQLVGAANDMARDALRLPSPPALQASTVGKMGLRGTPGLVIAAKGDVRGGGQQHGGGNGNGNGSGRGAAHAGAPQQRARPAPSRGGGRW